MTKSIQAKDFANFIEYLSLLVAKYLQDHGYKKKARQNGKLDYFTTNFIKAVLDNPVYMGC